MVLIPSLFRARHLGCPQAAPELLSLTLCQVISERPLCYFIFEDKFISNSDSEKCVLSYEKLCTCFVIKEKLFKKLIKHSYNVLNETKPKNPDFRVMLPVLFTHD